MERVTKLRARLLIGAFAAVVLFFTFLMLLGDSVQQNLVLHRLCS